MKINKSIQMGNWLELMKAAKEMNAISPGSGNKCLQEANEISAMLRDNPDIITEDD